MKKLLVGFITLVIVFVALQVSASEYTAEMKFYCNDVLCTNGKYKDGTLMLICYDNTLKTPKNIIGVIAQYDADGNLLGVAINDGKIGAGYSTSVLYDTQYGDAIKCMMIDASTLAPLGKGCIYKSNTVIEIPSWNLDYSYSTVGKAIEYYESFEATKTTRIYTNSNTRVYVNGNILNETAINLYKLYGRQDAEIRFVESNDDKYIDDIYVSVYEHALVNSIDVDNGILYFENGKRLYVDLNEKEKTYKIVNKKGKQIEFGNIKPGDVLALAVEDELMTGQYLPVSANEYAEKITIHNLGNSTVSGLITGSNEYEGLIRLDYDKTYYVSPAMSLGGEYYFDYDVEYCDCLGKQGLIYIGKTGLVVGYNDSVNRSKSYGSAGIIMDSNTNGEFYTLSVLGENGEVVEYNVDKSVLINGNDFSYDEQNRYLNIEKYNNSADVTKRIIRYFVSDGTIHRLDFPKDIITTKSVNAPYYSQQRLLGDSNIYEEAVVFDLTNGTTVGGIDVLKDNYKYAGYVADKDLQMKYHIVVITNCSKMPEEDLPSASVDEWKNKICVVNSMMLTTYDNKKAVILEYYSGAEYDIKKAIFTEDSQALTDNYNDADKGTLFVADVDSDGVVKTYGILARTKFRDGMYYTTTIAENFKDICGDYITEKYNGAEYIYGYINTISGNVINVAGRDFMITSEASCYHYNDKGAKPKFDVGNWNTEYVDVYDSDEGTATPVYIKLYAGKVTDIVTFSVRVAVDDINWCITTHSDSE